MADTTPPQGIFETAEITVGANNGYFQGVPWVDYALIHDGDLNLVCNFQPVFSANEPTRCLHRIAGTLPANTFIEIDETGLVRIVTPQGYKLDFWRRALTESLLNNRPYLNCYGTDPTNWHPSSFSTATGLLPQYNGSNAESFRVTTETGSDQGGTT